MTTPYNGRERPRSTPTYPPYSGKLTKVTGEGEQVELAFTADDAEQRTTGSRPRAVRPPRV
jgi:hypothetical protein